MSKPKPSNCSKEECGNNQGDRYCSHDGVSLSDTKSEQVCTLRVPKRND